MEISETASRQNPPGYPQKMMGLEMTPEAMQKLWDRREVKGMRANAMMAIIGLMTSDRSRAFRVWQAVADLPLESGAGGQGA